jgi:hypothetical protein
MVRRILLFCVVSVFLFPFTGFAAADGGIFVVHQDYFYVEEDSQFGVIDHADGIQSLFISVSFAWQESSKTAWIFPVPSDPNRVEASIVDGDVSFAGTDIVESARDEVVEAAQEFTAGYCLSFALPWFMSMMTASSSVGWGTVGYPDVRDRTLGTGVTVYSHVEMEGLIVEVIAAKEGEGIYHYLAGNGLHMSEGAVPQLDEYVQDEFSFVVTWIEETGTTLREPGVIVRFPTDEMYYPLKLTSVYGDHEVPMKVIVTGHVSPKVYWDILPHTEVSYYEGSVSGGASYGERDSPAGQEMESFVDAIRDRWDGEFTVIELSAPSKAFTEDLWISSDVPPKVPYAVAAEILFGSAEIVTFFLIFLVLSPFIGIAVGAKVFGPGKEYISAAMGLSNLVGILGLLVFAFSFRLGNEISVKQGLSFVVLFSIAFYAAVMMLIGLAFLPML